MAGSFKLPQLTPKPKRELEAPKFEWINIVKQKKLGCGSFGSVYLAKYKGDGDHGHPIDVVVKKLKSGSVDSQTRFVKEAKIQNSVKGHRNITEFLGFCNSPYSIMMQYSCFDFSLFGVEKCVTSLADFLQFVDSEYDFSSFSDVLPVCLKDVVNGLDYLHTHNIAHRDLKPNNILVSNQHLSNLKFDEIQLAKAYKECPIVCRLTDFGLSRSVEIQTKSVLKSKTTAIWCGTPAFMSPEILLNQLNVASQEDLKRADIWSLGLVLHAMMNSEEGSLYRAELAQSGVVNPEDGLRNLMRKRQLPQHGTKYEQFRVTMWWQIEDVFHLCANFDPMSRPPTSELLDLLRASEDNCFHRLPLSASQNTAIEQYDYHLAAEMQNRKPQCDLQAVSCPSNDATNSCAFLSLGICDRILNDTQFKNQPNWEKVREIAEDVICNLPANINMHRDHDRFYDVVEAYSLLLRNNFLNTKYEFSEEFISGNTVFSTRARDELVNSLVSRVDQRQEISIAIYTCSPYIFTIGVSSNAIFLVDTHPVNEELGGNGNGLLAVTPDCSRLSCKWIVQWVLKRLMLAGVKQNVSQSMAWLTEYHESEQTGIEQQSEQHSGVRKVLAEKISAESQSIPSQHESIYCEEKHPDNNERHQHKKARYSLEADGLEEIHSIPLNVDRSNDGAKLKERSKSETDTSQYEATSSGDSKQRYAGEPYNGDIGLPVYEWATKIKNPLEVMEILLKPVDRAKVCEKVPNYVSNNVCFILDRNVLKAENDWKCDDMGAWRNNGVHRHHFGIHRGDIFPLGIEEDIPNKDHHVLKRMYFKNSNSTDLKKLVSYVEGFPRWIFIQYVFDLKEHSVTPAPHGNSKRKHSTPYVRIKESTMCTLKHKAVLETPKNAYHSVNEEQGGVKNAASISDLPRNRAQAKYSRRGYTDAKSFNHIDSLIILLEQCKRQQLESDEQAFIREVIGAPEMRCILGFDFQFQDIATFCTDPTKFTVFAADPTFNLGKFNATVTSFANLKVVNRVGGNHPTMIGPILLSQTKSFDSYNQFFSKIVSLNKGTRGILAFGTDGEEELFKAMKYNFPHAIHLRCFSHFRDNCKAQLRLSNVPEQAQKEILFDIFGRRIGTTWEKGLLDADDKGDLKAKLLTRKVVWNTIEQKYLPKGEKAKFYQYILDRLSYVINYL